MSEASGSSFADAAGGADAEVSGGVTLGEPGGLVEASSTAALFDGSSGSAQAGVDLSGSGKLTVEFWMKWKAFANDDRLAMEFTPNFNENVGGFLVDPNASVGTFGVGVGEYGARNNVFFARPSAEHWHYYAFVIDTEGSGATEITPYVDGHAVSYTKTESGTGGGFANSTLYLYWMSRDASSLFGAGSMQDLALYDGTLSASAILEHYEIGQGGPKASFTSLPVVASAGVPVRLDASGSSSPGGSITDYAWDFDGSKTYSSSDKASASKTPQKASFGLSDEQKSAFDKSEEGGKVVDHFDSRLKNGRLAVKTARLIVNYNTSPHSEMLHEWVEAVEKEGLKPYITFRSCVPQQPNYGVGKDERPRCPSAPSPTSASFPGYYYNHVLALMKELIKDEVRTFGAWNEPNKYNDPLHLHPKRAAVLWGEAQHAAEHLGCGLHCIVVAGEFTAYQKGYIGHYVSTILHDAKIGIPTKTKATFWGLHDYNDVKNIREETRAGKGVIAKSYRNIEAQSLVHYIKTKRLGSTHIWLSEQGVQVETNTNKSGKTRLTGNSELQRLAARDVLRLGDPSERVERVYYYGYRGPSKAKKEELESKKPPEHPFDSALLSGEGFGVEPENWRPTYCVLALGNNEGCPAKVATRPPVSGTITPSATTVLATIDPRGSATNYWLEWGTSTEYGHTTTATAAANQNGEQSETLTLSGLEPCTTYHYQAEAENEANEGTPSLGGDQTFTTSGCRSETGAVALTANIGHACALLESKRIDCWGENFTGELGNGTNEETLTPVEVSGIDNAVAVTTGAFHSCALLTDGSAACWGLNRDGQLGNGELEGPETCEGYGYPCSKTPVAVSGVTNAVKIGPGSQNNEHTCVVLASGGVDCWGSDGAGELGNGTQQPSISTPVAVSGIDNATDVTMGFSHTCAVLSEGSVDCWGSDYEDQLGNEAYAGSDVSVPVQVSGISNAIEVAAGAFYTCALLSTGGIDCWGENDDGQLGDGTTEEPSTPVSVMGITDAIGITAGGDHTCAVLAGGSIDCWGDNEYGELGTGATTGPNACRRGFGELKCSYTPVAVTGISNAMTVAASYGYTCALLTSEKIDCWGDNEYGQLGDGTREDSLTPVPVTGIG